MERGRKRLVEEGSWPSSKHPKLGLGPMMRFEPTDAELVAYLEMLIRSEPVPEGIIHPANVYSHHPQTLTGMYSPAHDVRREWYFFTPREAKYPNGRRPDRRAGNSGFWKATSGVHNIVQDNVLAGGVVGRKKSLVFYESLPGSATGKKQKKTNWIMHEYEHVSNNAQFQSWVLCRIHHNGKQQPPAAHIPEFQLVPLTEEAAQPPAAAADSLLEDFRPLPLCVAAPDGSYWNHMPALADADAAAAAAAVHETTWDALSPSESGATTAPPDSQYPARLLLDSAEKDFLDCDFDGGLMADMMSYLLDD